MIQNPPRRQQKATVEQGYTLVEFVIVLVIMSIVGSAAAGLYLNTTKWVKHWQSNIAMENSAHLLINKVSVDLQYADRVIALSDSSWVIEYKGDRDTRYTVADSSVYRNGMAVVDDGVNVLGFSIRLDSLFLEDQPGLLKTHRMMNVRIHLTMPPASFLLSTKTGMRQSEPWLRYVPSPDTNGVLN